jgi:hypothetical protein
MSVLETLIKARALIENPEKWGKGPPGERPGTFCAMQAIEIAGDADSRVGTYDAFLSAANCYLIVFWNDYPSRTHSDVLAAFDRAIEAERAKEAS